MTGEQNKISCLRSKRAQAIIELAVFGAVFIFVIGTIIQQGFSAASSQQVRLQAIRQALLASYNDGMSNHSARSSASLLIVEDRLSPGFYKYGTQDRIPNLSLGTGSMSRNLYMPLDWADVTAGGGANSIGVMDVRVNGQTFIFRTAVAYYLRLRRQLGAPSAPVEALASQTPWSSNGCISTNALGQPGVPLSASSLTRLAREWPDAYSVAAAGNTNFSGDADWQYDYNRNGDFSDDLWNSTPMAGSRNTGVSQVLWKWVRDTIPGVVGQVNAKDGNYPSYDVTGDMTEDVIYGRGAVFGNVLCGSTWYTVYDLNILDNGAAEISSENVYEYPDANERQGLKQESSISTAVNGAVLDFRGGQWYVSGTNDLAMSRTGKDQYDIITRVYQLNRKMLFPGVVAGSNPGAIEVACGAAWPLAPVGTIGSTGCCMVGTNATRTCLDVGSRTLYIRSRIRDTRGRMWINRTH